MSTLSYKSSNGHLKEREKNILVCVLLSSLDQLKVNHQLCADEIGMSKGGFENAYRAIIKKLKENNCYVGEQAIEPAGDAEKPLKKAAGRKRKVDTEGEEDGNKSPVKKPRNSRAIKVKAEEEDDENADKED